MLFRITESGKLKLGQGRGLLASDLQAVGYEKHYL